MAEPREALEVRVDDEADDRDRPQPAHDRVELPDGDEEQRERGDAEDDDLRDRELAARDLAAGGARVPRVDPRVDQPVERHRERAGADHRERDPEEVVRARPAVDREKGADVRERQREDRVLDLDEPREPRRQRRRGGRGGHVCSWAVGASASSSSACASAGRRTANPSRQPPGEPGRLTTSVEPTHARGATREQAVRRLRDRVRPQRLRDARGLALEHVARRLRRHVPRREPGAAGREHEPRRAGELPDRRRDLVALVGNDAPLDVVALAAQAARRGRRRFGPPASRPRLRRRP